MRIDISKDEIKWFQNTLISWGRTNYFDFPWRSCKSPIHQLLSEILLQRTKAEQVVSVFQKILDNYPDLESLSQLSESDFSEIIYPLGLHWRGPVIYKLIVTIRADFKGNIPEDKIQLEQLPGVGQYVSSSYLSLHRNKRASIVDSNVVRVYARYFGFDYDGETRRKKWLKDIAERITPKRAFCQFNYALLDFAREICKANPSCILCHLRSRCYNAKKNEEMKEVSDYG